MTLLRRRRARPPYSLAGTSWGAWHTAGSASRDLELSPPGSAGTASCRACAFRRGLTRGATDACPWIAVEALRWTSARLGPKEPLQTPSAPLKAVRRPLPDEPEALCLVGVAPPCWHVHEAPLKASRMVLVCALNRCPPARDRVCLMQQPRPPGGSALGSVA